VDQKIDVLIVDDQIKIRRGLKALLRFTPFIRTIWEALDGEAAMKIVSEVMPQLVIMDVKMPTMGGIEATRQIKHCWPEVKVIILTMYPIYEFEALAAGADRFLVKGDTTRSLQDEILSLFPAVNSTQEV
jgi:YesN/AraC family two-component response regulator